MDLMMFNLGCQFDGFLTEAHIITVSKWICMCIS